MIHYLYGVDEIPNFRNDEEAAKWMIINQYLVVPLKIIELKIILMLKKRNISDI